MNMSISTSQMPVTSNVSPNFNSAQPGTASKAPAGLLPTQDTPLPPPSSSPATARAVNGVGQMAVNQLDAERTEVDKLSAAQTQTALQEVNKVMDALSISVRFQIDPEDQQMVIKVVDQDSGKVIRQFPSEEVVRISKALDNLKGLLFAQTA
jgi:flagellar protein FlaG